MLRLGIDIDGVVADFQSAFRALAERELGRPAEDPDADLSRQDVDRLWKVVADSPNWWLEIQPYEPDQIARLYALARRQRWEVFFMTSRPESAGDAVQLQTQVWLERLGFYLPTVLTMPNGARGEIARSLRLDLAVDDRLVNCLEIVSASNAKALLLAREADDGRVRDAAEARGIGVVTSLAQGLDAVERLEELLSRRRGRLLRLSDWFFPRKDEPMLPHDPRQRRA
jgi:uncharacterized HAD superfamily protein